jgi:hypothetical protein
MSSVASLPSIVQPTLYNIHYLPDPLPSPRIIPAPSHSESRNPKRLQPLSMPCRLSIYGREACLTIEFLEGDFELVCPFLNCQVFASPYSEG